MFPTLSVESLVIIFIALAVGSMVKGISGLGLPLTAIPVMAGFMEVDRAVAIMVIPSFLINFWLMWTYRAHAIRLPNLPLIGLAGFLGVLFGAWLLSALPGWYLLLFMALWLGGYLLSLLFKDRINMPGSVSRHAPLLVVGAAGIVQGSVGTSGPVLAPYVHSLNLKQPQYVFAVSILFQIFTLTQFTSYLWLGLIDAERAFESALACIPIAIFLPIAVWLAQFFTDKGFNLLIITLLLVIEGRLVWRLFT